MADIMVEKTQRYLNAMYGGDSRYEMIPESVYGKTGWTTIYALTRALQIELGIQNTADSFGPTTIAKFNERFPNGVQQQANGETTTNRIYAIIQGACWCKGYSTGASGITENFYGGTGGAIQRLKADAGIADTTSTVTLNVMKALLSMDQFVLVSGGHESIRTVQQRLNRKYEDYIGLIPCDGLYGRQMNKAMIIALQKIEGYSKEEATGNFGDGTKAKLPVIPLYILLGTISQQESEDYIALIRYALCCNGFLGVDIDSNQWDTHLSEIIKDFQEEMLLPQNGACDVNTWMSLLLSKGNPDRDCIACDTRFEITDNVAKYLKDNGYQIVGRYLTGGDFKELRKGEAKRILDAGLKFFPIFQESGANLSYFTYERGKQDAKNAVKAARKHGIEGDNYIYFAVDTDPTDDQISTYILPYFKGVSDNMSKSYKIGVYGTRNVCTKVVGSFYAGTCFVSDMSTGFSGNMGFKMPQSWNLDQFSEIKNISIGNTTIDLDKVAYSGKQPVVENVYKGILEFNDYIRQIEELYFQYYVSTHEYISGDNISHEIRMGVANFLRNFKYRDYKWFASLPPIDDDFIIYVINSNEDLFRKIAEYANTDAKALIDGTGGYIDIGHMGATVEGYGHLGLVPNFMFGWGGDLASLMKQVDTEYPRYPLNTHLEIAKALLGDRSNFNYSDICTDADVIKINKLISSSDHPLSDAINYYYTNIPQSRFVNYLDDLDCSLDFSQLKTAIKNKMIDTPARNLVTQILGDWPSDEAFDACCEAFAQYIIDSL